MSSTEAALNRLDLFLRTYPVRVLRQQRLGGITADYHCPLAGIAILLVKASQDDARKKALTAQGLTVLTLRTTALTRSFDEVCTFIDDNIKRALTTKS